MLALAACGGEQKAAPPAPKLPSALGAQLAAEADAIAQQLVSGDPCGAAGRAVALQQGVIAALNRPGQVPTELKEDLGVAAADLVDRAQAECAAAQPPPAPLPATTTAPEADEDEGEDNGRGRGKGKGKGKKRK